MDSDEDLCIKMNSRGKPLTPFEHFKARFEQHIKHSDRAGDFAHKIDGAWSDLLWPIHGGDNIVDDEFICYIDFITKICELREGRVASGRLGPRARAVFGTDNQRTNTWASSSRRSTGGRTTNTSVPSSAVSSPPHCQVRRSTTGRRLPSSAPRARTCSSSVAICLTANEAATGPSPCSRACCCTQSSCT